MLKRLAIFVIYIPPTLGFAQSNSDHDVSIQLKPKYCTSYSFEDDERASYIVIENRCMEVANWHSCSNGSEYGLIDYRKGEIFPNEVLKVEYIVSKPPMAFNVKSCSGKNCEPEIPICDLPVVDTKSWPFRHLHEGFDQ